MKVATKGMKVTSMKMKMLGMDRELAVSSSDMICVCVINKQINLKLIIHIILSVSSQ